MVQTEYQFLLFSQVQTNQDREEWHFVLQSPIGEKTLEANDCEADLRTEQLELMAVIRGLEALDHPCEVTLVTNSDYVRKGIVYGLEEWKGNNWQWEYQGQLVPIKNQRLWQRLDRALKYHRLHLGERRGIAPAPHFQPRSSSASIYQPDVKNPPLPHWQFPPLPLDHTPALHKITPKSALGPFLHRLGHRSLGFDRILKRAQRRTSEILEKWYLSCARLGTGLLPLPWFE